MDEKKELIYREEAEPHIPVDPLPPPMPPTCPPPPAHESASPRTFAGLMVGVAIFAMAFLLCDGLHTVRQRAAASDSHGGWVEQLLAGSFAEGGASDTPDGDVPTSSEQPEGTESTTSDPTSDTVSDDTSTAPAPAITPEELYAHDAAAVPQGMIPIVPMDLSLSAYGEAFHYNDTSYRLTLSDLPQSDRAIPASAAAGEVSVLILHTHATEGYSEEGATYYDPATVLARAEKPSDGVIAVGQVIADILNEQGIVTLHSTTLHDAESYKDSYSRSAQTVREYLAKYPSIRLVIDVHRDSIMTSGDQLVRAVTVAEGEATAQVMCVVGSDASGAAYANWQENLALAVRLRQGLNERYGNLCRPVYIKKSAYNQQYAPASLLLEIGSSGNSLEEAKRAAALVAAELLEMLA